MGKIIKHMILEFLKEKAGVYTNKEISNGCLKKYSYLKLGSVNSIITLLSRSHLIEKSYYPPYTYRINKRGIKVLEELDNTYVETCDFGCYKKDLAEKYETMTESEILEKILSHLSEKNKWMTAREISEHLDLPSHYPSRIASKLRLLYQQEFVKRIKGDKVFLYLINKNKKVEKISTPNKEKIIYLDKKVKSLLDDSIKNLLEIGVNIKTIDKICCESLEALFKDQVRIRREFEINYLKRENSLFLKEFELMKNEVIILEKELNEDACS